MGPKRFVVAKIRHNRAKFSRLGTSGRRKTTASVANVSSRSKSNASQNAMQRTGNREKRQRKKRLLPLDKTNGKRKTVPSVANVCSHQKSNVLKFATQKIENLKTSRMLEKLFRHSNMP